MKTKANVSNPSPFDCQLVQSNFSMADSSACILSIVTSQKSKGRKKKTVQVIERLSNDCRKTKTKAITPITTGTNRPMNQSQFLAITCNSPEAREKSRLHGAIGFGFASHWLKNWRESF